VRISFLLSSLWLSGGVRVVIEFASRLAVHGHQIALVYPGGTLDPDLQGELHPDVRLLPTETLRTNKPLGLVPRLKLAWELAKLAPPSDFIVSTHTPTTPSTFIASKLMKKGLPVWLYQDYLEMFAGKPIQTWLLKNALRWHRCALVVSDYSQAELSQFASGKVHVVGEGLSHAEFYKPLPPAARLGDHSYKRYLMTMGDMRPRKGFFDFLQAASQVYTQVPDLHLWIVAKDACEFDTAIPYDLIYRPSRDELARLYASCDIFVSASWWESFGLPPLEAMACGAPVVLADARATSQYAQPGENCLITPARRPDLLAQAILQVLSDPELEASLREQGPQTAAQFAWEPAVERFERALAGLRA
jgi:glycosyltransferase involved in cell wall biosynthesis